MAKRPKKRKVPLKVVSVPVAGSEAPSPQAALTPTPWNIWLPLVLALITFLVYWPSLFSDFVYDARKEILEEGFITSISNLPAILSLKVLSSHLMLGDRPGQLLYMMLIASVCGRQPFGYHLCSNLLHAANVALLFVFLRQLVASERLGLLENNKQKVQLALLAVVSIFALHPIAVEPVSGISYSSDLLVTLFTLCALLAATAFRPENFRVALLMGGAGTLCAFAAVTCKESGVATSFLLIVYWFLFRRGEAKLPWSLFLGSALGLTMIFLALRFFMAAPVIGAPGYLDGSFSQAFLIQPRLWVYMMGQLIWPIQLSADYTPENVSGLSTPFAWAVLIVILSFQIWLALKSRIGALGVAIYWLGLATVSNFIPLYRVEADRFYYLPLAGVTLQLLSLLLLVLKSPWGFWVSVPPLLVATLPLTILTITRQHVFASDSALWSDTLKASPSSFTAHNDFGDSLLDKGNINEAIAQYQKSLEINPQYAEAHNNLGSALARNGRLDEAMIQYQTALAINPDLAATHDNLGAALDKKGHTDEAIVQYQKALAINPRDAATHFNLGYAYFKKGETDQAIAEYQTALQINPQYADVHNNLANTLKQIGRWDEAIAEYQKALESTPNDADVHNNLGNALLQQGRVDQAIDQYQKALALDPDNANTRFSYGHALSKKGLIDQAIDQYQKALEINPHDPKARTNLGTAYIQTGRIDQAIAQYQKAVQMDPNYVEARNNLGNALLQKGQVTQAITQYQNALAIKPDYADARNNLGIVLLGQGRVDQAIDQFQQVLRANPQDQNAQENLTRALASRKAPR